MKDVLLNPDNALINKPLSDEWWHNFVAQSKHFTEPIVIRDVLALPEIQDLNHLTYEVIAKVCEMQTDEHGFRVYIDGKKQEKAYIRDHVFVNLPQKDDDGTEWVKQTFGDKKFGIIMNYGEKFSEEFGKRLTTYIDPLLRSVGMPSCGLHTTIFIGNYGFTPLGIHQDHFGANVIHFHLGPSPKTMYTWDADVYKSLTNNGKDVDLPALIPHAKSHYFEAGDIFYMPWDKFHIGNTPEYSIGVTVWFDNHSKQQLMNRLISHLNTEYAVKGNDEITRPVKTSEGLKMDKFDRVVKAAPGLSFRTALEAVYTDFKLALFSNRGWREISFDRNQLYRYQPELVYAELAGTTIQVMSPYQIYYLDGSEELSVFVRGSKVKMRRHPGLIAIINRLNSWEALSVDDLMDQHLADWPKEAGLYFLALIYNKRGFERLTG